VQNIAHFAEMHPACPVCKVSYHPEPGFYFGAMYITYAINVVLVVVVGALANYVLDIQSIFQLLIIAIAAVLITPFSFRFSRILWLYWFGGIKPRSDAD
jgi:phosphoglycerol transferase MdoB-like AlkP superfamily enzyme